MPREVWIALFIVVVLAATMTGNVVVMFIALFLLLAWIWFS